MQIEISRRGIRHIPTPPGARLAQSLKLIRIGAVTFAAWIVVQTAVVFALDAVL